MMISRSVLLFALLWLFAPVMQAQYANDLIAQGDSLLEADQAKKAMAKFGAALDLSPSANTYSARARGWYYQGKYDKALLDVEKALKLDSLFPQANYQRALYALNFKDNTGAIRYCSRGLVVNEKPELRRQLLVLRGEAEAASGLNAAAIADLQEGLGGRTEDLSALKTLARLNDATGDHEASLVVLKTLCEVDSNAIGNWSNRGFELNLLERYEDALPVLDKALTFDKDEPVVLSNKAYALLKLNRNDEALTIVNHSLRADATNPYALRTRALLYLRKGQREKACRDLTLAKAIGSVPEVDRLIKQYCSGGGN